jgi:hypothetical protein
MARKGWVEGGWRVGDERVGRGLEAALAAFRATGSWPDGSLRQTVNLKSPMNPSPTVNRFKYVGLDVHTETIAVAIADSSGDVGPYGIVPAHTRRATVLFGSRFVAHSSQTAAGMLVARRLAGAENPSRQTVSYLGYTTLGRDGGLLRLRGRADRILALPASPRPRHRPSPLKTTPGYTMVRSQRGAARQGR